MGLMNQLTMLGTRAGFWGSQSDLDTVIFVHGLKGHFQATWGDFPRLLDEDPSMPEIDILLWGYPTGAFSPLVHDPETIGKHLISAMNVHISERRKIFLVGHSMGGFVLLEGLVGEMIGRRADRHPTSSVGHISLFASPVSGVTASTVVANTFGKLFFLRKLFNKQIRALAKGSSSEKLLTQVESRIYKPNVEDSSARFIPIRMIMATRDGAVSESDRNSFKARFSEMSPLEFDYGHSSLKEPSSRHDERYKALANDIQDRLAERFALLCDVVITGNADDRDDAQIDIERQFGKIFKDVFKKAGGSPKRDWVLYKDYTLVVIANGSSRRRTAVDTATRATMALRRAGKLPYG